MAKGKKAKAKAKAKAEEKGKVVRGQSSETGPFDVWKGITITVGQKWDKGELNLKGQPDPATFKIVAKKVDYPGINRPLRFEVIPSESNPLPSYWTDVVLLPVGSKDPKAVPKLGNSNPTADEVRSTFAALFIELNVSSSKLKRLEGFIPVRTNDPNMPALDEVRMLYLKGVLPVENKPGKFRDFVLVNFRSPGTDPNGGGSGPPDR